MAGSDSSGYSELRGCRVLIIEDEMLVAMELESILQQQGCVVLGPVKTLERALALLETARPDAALLDLNLNGKPAAAVGVALASKGVPFVITTGYGETKLREPEMRAAPLVEKPIDSRKLLHALAGALRS